MSEMVTEKHFGTLLREARQRANLSTAEVADGIKISQTCLEALEQAKWGELPPDIFVRGFVKSYARIVGLAEAEPLALFDQELSARRRSDDQVYATAAGKNLDLLPLDGVDGMPPETDVARRPVGLALFVVIVLVISIVAISYLLQQPPVPGEGLSLETLETQAQPLVAAVAQLLAPFTMV